MLRLTLKHPAPRAVSEAEFDAVFNELGITLPSDFREFYLIHHGTTPIENLYKKRPLYVFLAVRVPDGWQVPTVADAAVEVRDMLELDHFAWLPFASDPGGNYTCLKLTEPNAGAVYFIDHHMLGDDPEQLICPSFWEYVNGLVPRES